MWSKNLKKNNVRSCGEWLSLGHVKDGTRTHILLLSFSILIFFNHPESCVHRPKWNIICWGLPSSCAVAMEKFMSAAWSHSLSGPRLPRKPDLIPKQHQGLLLCRPPFQSISCSCAILSIHGKLMVSCPPPPAPNRPPHTHWLRGHNT